MQKLLLTNSDNSLFEVDLVRYFEYNGEYFLIYTLNETDEKNYLKLYLVEVLEELGELVCYSISDDDTWKNMQNIIKSVIKEIKSNKRELLRDIDPHEIEKLKVNDSRYFKLDKKLADILSSDYDGVPADEIFSNEEITDELINDNLIIEPIDLPEDEIVTLKINEAENIIVEPIDVKDEIREIKPVKIITDECIIKLMTPVEETVTISEEPIDIINTTEELIEINNTEIIEKPIEINNIEVSDEINYKELYFAIKEEKEATDLAFEELLEQLMAYKEKFGEL